MQFHLKVGARREGACRCPRFQLALGRAGEEHVPDKQPRVLFSQAEQRAARRDLDIVRMRAQRKHQQRSGS
jgi:hypothetical protein